jgi:hypothetical protein
LTNLALLIETDAKKISYLENLMPIVLSQVLSSNFHLRTFVEAILLKLHYFFNETHAQNGLNSRSLLASSQISSIRKQIYAIIKTSIDE